MIELYDENKLRGAIVAAGNTPRAVSKLIGMSERTFYRKLKSGKWNTDEVKAIAGATPLSKEATIDIFLA
jgi:hypothetical protein